MIIFPNWITDIGVYTTQLLFFVLVVWGTYELFHIIERKLDD